MDINTIIQHPTQPGSITRGLAHKHYCPHELDEVISTKLLQWIILRLPCVQSGSSCNNRAWPLLKNEIRSCHASFWRQFLLHAICKLFYNFFYNAKSIKIVLDLRNSSLCGKSQLQLTLLSLFTVCSFVCIVLIKVVRLLVCSICVKVLKNKLSGTLKANIERLLHWSVLHSFTFNRKPSCFIFKYQHQQFLYENILSDKEPVAFTGS